MSESIGKTASRSVISSPLFGTVLILGAGLGIAYYIYKKTTNSPTIKGALTWWGAKLGTTAPGTPIPDITGTAGDTATQTALGVSEGKTTITLPDGTVAVGYTSQAYYDAVLQEFAYNNNFDMSLDAQGTEHWPWKSYDFWAGDLYPPLPDAKFVTVDEHGQFHNEYV